MRRCLLVLVLLGALVGAGTARARELDVRVVEPPERLGEEGTMRLLRQSLPGLRVVPAGSGELVLSGLPATVATALELLDKLDRPPREVVVEVRRAALDQLLESEWRLGAGVGGRNAPTTLRRVQGSHRADGARTLRLREGSHATLFVGDEVPYTTGGVFSRTRFVSAGAGVRVSLVRVDPGRGALLDLSAEHGGLGASTPAGPTVHRDRVSTRVFAEFGVPTPVGGFTTSGGNVVSSRELTGEVGLGELRVRDPNAGFTRGSRGLPSGRRVRRPLRGSASVGRRRVSGGGQGTWVVLVREVPAASPARRDGSPRRR